MIVREYVSDTRAREKPCLRCGLSLRKHLDDRHCPQCGLSVWMSLNSNEALDYSNAKWLRKAGRAAWVMAAIQVVALAAYLVALLATFAMPHGPTGPSGFTPHASASRHIANAPGEEDEDFADDEEAVMAAPVSPSAPLAIAGALAGIYFILEAGGLIMLTVHEERYPDRAKAARVGSRIAAACAVIVGITLLALTGSQVISNRPIGAMHSWITVLVVEFTFAGCAVCSWLWAGPVARRGGQSSLARLCGYLLFLPVLPFLKAAPFFGMYFLYMAIPLLRFVPLIYIPLSVYLFARCAQLLQQAIPHAEAAWAAETKPVTTT